MSVDHLLSDRTDLKAGYRHNNLALRWESVTGEGRILAKGTEAVTLYQSDMVEGFRSLTGGFIALGRVQDDGSFRPMIRQAIPLQVVIPELAVPKDDSKRIEDGGAGPHDDASIYLANAIADAEFLMRVIDTSIGEQSESGTGLLA